MSLWRHFICGLRVLANRRASDTEIADELAHYLDEAAAAHLAQGMSPAEARRAARLELGGITALHEQVRGYGWENRLALAFADLRYTLRTLLRAPSFTTVSVLTLALGIAASTAMFSIVDTVLLRPLPYPHPEQIVRIWEQAPDGHRMNLAGANFRDFLTQNHTFSALAEYGQWLSSVSGGSEPVRLHVAEVSSQFFQALGVSLSRGRAFSTEELRPHGTPAVIVSYRYWQHQLNAAPSLAHLQLRMDDALYPIVGVMPESFDFPAETAAWIPTAGDLDNTSRSAHNWRAIGRLLPSVTVPQARADLGLIARRLKQQFGKDVDLNDAAVIPLAESLVAGVRTALLILLAASALLLLVACANVAGLLIARASARRKELAVRLALGAGRARLIQQFLAESFTLSLAAGVLGILLAAWFVRILPAILPTHLPGQQVVSLNPAALLFAFTTVLAVAFSLGLLAAWRAASGDLQDSLATGSRSVSDTPAAHRLRTVLVVGEIAATLLILVGAGLLGRSFVQLISANPGFNGQNLTTIEFAPPVSKIVIEPQPAKLRQIQLVDAILARLRLLPGVESVAFAGALPVAAGDNLADGEFLILHGQTPPANFDEWARISQNPSQTGHALYCLAGDDYFHTLSIPLIRGRLFHPSDDANAPHVALISQALARRRWPGQNPLGETIDFGNMDGDLHPLTIVGIVGDVRAEGLNFPPSPIIYLNYRQRGINANSTPAILLRRTAPAGPIVSAARVIFHELAPDVPVKFSSFDDELGNWLADRRFLLSLVASFAAAALALAEIGIYGVVAFSAARRTREIGIRLALGAQPPAVLRLIVAEGAWLALLGVAIGTVASLALTRLLAGLLFAVSPTDPLTFFAVALLLTTVALLASYLPARRALRLDPHTALRCE